MQKLSDIIYDEPNIVLDLAGIKISNRDYPVFEDVLPILHERQIKANFIHRDNSRIYLNKHIEGNKDGRKGVCNMVALRSGRMFVNDNELIIPLTYNHDQRKVFGGTYVLLVNEDDRLPTLLQNQLNTLHALESYTPYMRSLHQMAYIDPLTDLGNKRSRDEYLKQTKQGSILAIDINRFKQVNDSFGHEHGNSVLAELGVLIDRYFLRAEDRGFRWGGEEFTVILPNTPTHHAKEIATDFYRHVAKHQFSTSYVSMISRQSYIYDPTTVTVSIGTADIGENCLQMADASLYDAKAIQRRREAKSLTPLSPQLDFPVK